MNTVVTSREAILAACRQTVASSGLSALNMREIAAQCHVAVGSIYHYFPSKAELMGAAVQDIWQYIFHAASQNQGPAGFTEYVGWIYSLARQGEQEFPRFFSEHALGFTQGGRHKARERMENCFSHMKSGLLAVLQRDPAVDPRAFGEQFTREDFVDFVFSSLLACLAQGKEDCKFLLEVLRRVLYPHNVGE